MQSLLFKNKTNFQNRVKSILNQLVSNDSSMNVRKMIKENGYQPDIFQEFGVVKFAENNDEMIFDIGNSLIVYLICSNQTTALEKLYGSYQYQLKEIMLNLLSEIEEKFDNQFNKDQIKKIIKQDNQLNSLFNLMFVENIYSFLENETSLFDNFFGSRPDFELIYSKKFYQEFEEKNVNENNIKDVKDFVNGQFGKKFNLKIRQNKLYIEFISLNSVNLNEKCTEEKFKKMIIDDLIRQTEKLIQENTTFESFDDFYSFSGNLSVLQDLIFGIEKN